MTLVLRDEVLCQSEPCMCSWIVELVDGHLRRMQQVTYCPLHIRNLQPAADTNNTCAAATAAKDDHNE